MDDIFVGAVYSFFEFGDEIFGEFEDEEGGFHMLPGDVEVFLFYWHFLMEFDHVWSFVVVGSTEEEGQELHHGRV